MTSWSAVNPGEGRGRVDGRDYTGFNGRDFDLERLHRRDQRAELGGWDAD